ncbi:GNAT family N-acetyltransferase [Adhaeribacter aquaticus]|uniref:GNAT family N-acetyltransferase n=1 Tax=Adhaeribacter aquaticus TaxID=299567 RepID=UPI0003FE5505|nr:GNAT family N-acetyltransferase [Adhaeribacter aquaticus]
METTVNHDKDNQEFSITLENDQAELAYSLPKDNVMNFQHTFVPENFRGKGVAFQLIKTGLEYAQNNNYKVIASCPIVAAYIRKHKEYEPLLDTYMI